MVSFRGYLPLNTVVAWCMRVFSLMEIEMGPKISDVHHCDQNGRPHQAQYDGPAALQSFSLIFINLQYVLVLMTPVKSAQKGYSPWNVLVISALFYSSLNFNLSFTR